ncbi:MAG: metal-dependent transcriptional regulator [Kiritimatiellae bacterium]|nr:metal-dependent transcriptional regulator [Kiritimatiellia bacterium]
MKRGGRRRALIEDALKFLLDRAADEVPPTTTALGRAVHCTPAQTRRLCEELRAGGWVEGDPPTLTAAGREYAAQVARAHRLYETHLARTSGLPSTDWHRLAHAEEHRLTPRAADALARQLGEPAYDPHGDPIPSREGRLPPRRGRPLEECPPGWKGQIVHVEDEPAESYQRLAREGFAPDARIRVLGCAAAGGGMRVSLDGREIDLSRTEAALLTVDELPRGVAFDEQVRRLSDLEPGGRAVVVGLSPQVRGLARDRLLDLGFVPGTTVELVMRAPSGDPIAYRVRGATIALRREQADRILVHLEAPAPAERR